MSFTPDGQKQSTLHIRIGSTFKKQWRWATGTPAVNVDLTGWTAACEIKTKATDVTPLLRIETGGVGNFLTLGADGLIELEIQYGDAGTELFSGKKKGVFDIELTNPGSTFRRNLIGGEVIFYGEVTQP